MTGIPTNWTQLRAAEEARLDKTLSDLEAQAKLVSKVLDRGVPTLARAMRVSSELLARLLVIGGADRARSACFLADGALPRLLDRGDEPATAAPSSAVAVLSYAGIMRCVGVNLPANGADVESRWLRVVAQRPDLLNEPDLRTAALAAVAVGEPELVPEFTGGGALVARNTTRRIAGPNLPGFARHLAEVIEGGGGREAVEDPWRSFLQGFPLTLAEEGCRWIDLVWAAMAIMVHFEQRPASDVGTWLPRLVQDLD